MLPSILWTVRMPLVLIQSDYDQRRYSLRTVPMWTTAANTRPVTPRGHEFLFFSLFSIIGKTSSFIGPFVSSAIIDTVPSHNPNSPFYFLFALSIASFLFLFFFVDLKKSRIEQALFLEEEAVARKELAGKFAHGA